MPDPIPPTPFSPPAEMASTSAAAPTLADQQDDRRGLWLFGVGAVLLLSGVLLLLWREARPHWLTEVDGITVLIACLSAMACALPGNFLVLRKLSMMGDAISHAVLPGLVVAFLLAPTTGDPSDRAAMYGYVLVGAVVAGLLTAVFTQAVNQLGKVEESAAMGVVFTSFFAIGLLFIQRAASKVHLDADCVLYGDLSAAIGNQVTLPGGLQVPMAALTIGGVLLLNIIVITLLYKEFKISSFDPALATAVGIRARWMHYLLMTLVAVTTVACFESVGSILVIAMLIVPPAVAHLLTDRLPSMIIVSLIVAALAAVFGHLSALVVPGWFGYYEMDLMGNSVSMTTSTSGMMAVCAGLLLLGAILAAPRHGLLAKQARQLRLTLRIGREDILGLLYRAEELDAPLSRPALLQLAAGARWLNGLALLHLRRRRLVGGPTDQPGLTETGRRLARHIIRSHRLWEAYGRQHLGKPLTDLHYTAESLEHITDPGLQSRLAARVDLTDRDPHGHHIPDEDP